MKNIITLALRGILLALSFVSIGSMAQSTADIALNYTIKVGGAKLGTLAAKLSYDGAIYQSTSETKAEGLASILLGGDLFESCAFTFDGQKVVSDSYSSSKQGRGAYQNETNFDWENNKISFGPEDPTVFEVSTGYVVDNCNMAFAAALSKGQMSTEEPFYIVDAKTRRIRGYIINNISDESISTEIGDLNTVKIEMQREEVPDRTLTLWLAEDRQHVLVRMVEKRSSRTTTVEIESIDGIFVH
ncbi:MAG TPA: hypothetical protein DCY55_09615 [Gammaproteobacteria bacterium]|jgi:hypothetical protein|nr:DUF3108 domain-containing protein [Pseudomonadota bacterium]HAY46523.1 hypothetical protein [Gammaproteobacteria bacterium]